MPSEKDNYSSSIKTLSINKNQIYYFFKKFSIKYVPFLLTFSIAFSYSLINSSPLWHDSGQYWNFANQFVKNNQFAITNYSNDLRGYLFPLILLMIKKISIIVNLESGILFYLYSSLLFSFLSTIVFPIFISLSFGWKSPPIRKVIFFLILFIYWKGYLLYPLSDILALTLLLLGIICLIILINVNKTPLWVAVTTGIFFASAMNVRPIYLISFFFAALALGVISISKHNRDILLRLIVFLLGAFLVLINQSLINNKHFNTASPIVLSNYNGQNLYIKLIFTGIRVQRYETNVGSNFPQSKVLFKDGFYDELLMDHGIRNSTQSLNTYFKLVLERPFEFTLLYFRHLFNGLDIKFDSPYVKNLYSDTRLFSFINYTFLFLCCWHIKENWKGSPDLSSSISLILLLSPVVLVIPTAVEIRFFLPVYILVYGFMSFRFIRMESITRFRSIFVKPANILRIGVSYTVFLIICFSLSNFVFNTALL